MVEQSSEQPAPYGGAPSGTPSGTAAAPPGGAAPARRKVRIPHLQQMKERGEKWAMLTAYDMYAAATFDEAGIPVLLVGDSASNNVYGNETSLPVTVDELIPLVRAVSRSTSYALVVADLPFGSYQRSPEQAYDTAVRFMKEADAHCVKLEGGAEMAPQVELLTRGGIPVMAHIGFTPQSEHSLGGYRIQGKGAGAEKLLADALAMEAAGAFAVVMEMVPGDVAAEVTQKIGIPTIGIGAGNRTDAQVLVWQDAMGLRTGRMPRFVKQYADLHGVMLEAAKAYAAEVADGSFPGPEHTF
jgi:3-methyl-2-oxobutanoate hydroxymethyltransferase